MCYGKRVRGLVVLLVTTWIVLALPASAARASDASPELAAAELRARAQSELRRLTSLLDARDRSKLVGIYVAFDPSASDPLAQVACDDDGDYVIVLSEALLRLLTHVARAASYEDAGASRKVEEYAGFLARSQLPGRRLLPPPPGFYIAERPAATYDVRLDEALSFVLARELAHLRAGDLSCPSPTATKESGDDTWTKREQRKARGVASAVYPGDQAKRDAEATLHVLSLGHTERGALALIRLFVQLELEDRVALGRFSPSYAVHHPGPALRAATVRHTAEARERATAPLTGP